MRTLEQRVDYAALGDTGVAVKIRLITSPVTLAEADALVGFLNRTLAALLEAWESERGQPHGLVPIVEIRSGSIEVVVRFMLEKKDAARDFAAAVATGIAAEIVAQLVWAIVGPNAGNPPPPSHTPAAVEQCVHTQVRPDLQSLYKMLTDGGKPFRVEIDDQRIVIQGNQPKSSPESRRQKLGEGDFDL
ncbi:MAG: hypothetical protein OEL20_19545 [Sulfuritalea sp.]|nr:hypothetical protein [Sulfuritalea sp.]